MYRKLFDSDWDIGVRIANHLDQDFGGCSRIIQIGIQIAFCESFDSDRNFGSCISSGLWS